MMLQVPCSGVEWIDNDACDLSPEARIDFPPGLRKLRSAKSHAARYRVLTPANCPGCACRRAKAQLVDSGRLARLDSLRLHSTRNPADLRSGTDALERGGHLSFCRCLRRDGPPLAGDDPCLRR